MKQNVSQNRTVLGAVSKSRSFSLGSTGGSKSLAAFQARTQTGRVSTAYQGVVSLAGSGSPVGC